MNEPVIIDLFVEDHAHEEFLGPLVCRVAEEETVTAEVRIRSARGGHARAIDEFRLYQKLIEKKPALSPRFVVVGIDGNCATFTKKKAEIRAAASPSFLERLVSACPDPHIERWYLADPDSFHSVVGHRPDVARKKCVRDHYKRVLADAVRKAGHPPTLGGIEFAAELVNAMDLYRAGRQDRSLAAFLEDLRGKFRDLKRQ